MGKNCWLAKEKNGHKKLAWGLCSGHKSPDNEKNDKDNIFLDRCFSYRATGDTGNSWQLLHNFTATHTLKELLNPSKAKPSCKVCTHFSSQLKCYRNHKHHWWRLTTGGWCPLTQNSEKLSCTSMSDALMIWERRFFTRPQKTSGWYAAVEALVISPR